MKRRWLKRLVAVLLIAVTTCAGFWFWYSSRDYGAVFLKRRGKFLGDSRSSASDVTLFSDSGLSAEVRMRIPAATVKVPGVLLAVGLETGKRVIDLVEPRDDLAMLAVDYGWREEFDVSTPAKLWRTLRQLRAVSDDAVPRLLLGLEYLSRQAQVDTNRLVVVGVSYGSYFALPAAALELRVSRLILVQGGGELDAVIAANARRWQAPVPPRVLGWIGDTLFLPFRPERWIERIAPRRVTFIASRTDPEFPVKAVESIYARAREPKELLWHDTPHVAPDAAEIIAELSSVVLQQLGAEQRRRQ